MSDAFSALTVIHNLCACVYMCSSTHIAEEAKMDFISSSSAFWLEKMEKLLFAF